MLIVKLVTLILLLIILYQDINSRSVYWILFPALVVLYAAIHFLEKLNFTEIVKPVLYNLSFLIFQFLLVTIYFTIKNRTFTNITFELLGWGDVLFLASTAFYPSVLNYVFYYMVSLVGILLSWTVWQLIVNGKDKRIPLAGLQSLIFALFLVMDWFFKLFNLTNDNWLLALITR